MSLDLAQIDKRLSLVETTLSQLQPKLEPTSLTANWVDQPAIVMEEIADPSQLAEARRRRKRFERNWAWFEANAAEIYRAYRGKCICISGQELFVGDTPAEVLTQAKTAHPEDEGRFTGIIPKERVARFYANQGRVAPL